MKKPIVLVALLAIGCVPQYLHYRQDPIMAPISNGIYTFSSTDYIYWGYSIRLEITDSFGLAAISDVRSMFTVLDTLSYRKHGTDSVCNEFSGRYLSFIQSNGRWILRVENPVTGYRFIGATNKFK